MAMRGIIYSESFDDSLPPASTANLKATDDMPNSGASLDTLLKEIKPSITSEVNVSNSTVLTAASDNQAEMSVLNSTQLEMNLYDPDMSKCPNRENQRVLISSDLAFYKYAKNFNLTGVNFMKAISNSKAKPLFNSASNAQKRMKTYKLQILQKKIGRCAQYSHRL
ncbi:hypothetical protein GQX74_008954 [Glossina fuscipes]|nr:hypothetical protein GQX74_008954 [Glossina fuscipes]